MLRTISCFVSLVISVCMCSYQSFAQQPTAVLSGTQTVCMIQPAQLTVTFTGTAPWSFSYTDGSITKSVSGVTQNPYVWNQATSTPLTTFSLLSLSDKNYSSGTVSGSAAVSWKPSNFLADKIPLTLAGPNPIYCPSGTTVLSTTPGYAKYRWFLGDTELTTATGSSLTVTAAGIYMVTAIDASCNIQSSLAITVSITEPFAKPVISGSTTLQCGTTTTLTATANYIKYDWMLNNVVVQSGSQNIINVNTYGEGSYTVKVYDATGCTNTSDAFRVTEVRPIINSLPENSLNTIPLRCLNGNNVLIATAGFNRYDWIIDGIVVKSGTDNTIDAVTAGPGFYSVKVYYPGGCTSTSLRYPIQFKASIPIPAVSASSTIMCPGQFISVNANPMQGFASFLWSNGVTSNQMNVSQPGTYTLVATDFAGCTASNSITITTPVTFKDVTIAANGPTRVCQQTIYDGAQLYSTSNYPGYTYFWQKNGFQYKSPMSSNNMKVIESGAYTLKVIPSPQTVPSVCYNTSNSIDVIVTPAPVTSSATYLCGALPSYSYTANGAAPNQRYRWYATYNSAAVLYTSTGPVDNTYSYTSNLIYVAIYDPASGCETSRTPLGYTVEPTTLADKVTSFCSEQTVLLELFTPLYNDYVGTHKWYTVSSGGTPVYTSNTNVLPIQKPTKDEVFYVEFLSAKGCQTNRAMYTVKYIMPPIPILSPVISCAGSSAIVTPSSSESGLYYFMYDTANNYVNQTNTSFSIPVPASGTKTYYISAYKDGCTGQSVPVTIDAANVTPVPVNNVSFTALCDQSATVTFTGTALPTATFNWDFQGATIISGSGVGPYKIRWTTAGKKFVVLQVIQNGCSSPQYVFSYTVPATPVPSFSISSTYCQNTTPIALTGSPAGGVFIGTGISGSAYTPSTAGTNTITYTYTNPADACIYTAVKTVTVNPLPVVSITGLNTSYCQSSTGLPVTVSPVGGILSGTGISGTTFTPSTQGQRTISYTYKDANNCSNTTTQSVTVNPVPTASFTGLDAAYCQNSPSSVLTGTPAGGTFSGDGISGNTFTPTKTGTNTITYTYQPNGCGIPAVKTTMVSAQIIPAITVTSSVPLATCGQSVTYTAAWANINTPALQWYVNAQPVSGATASTYNRIAAFGDRVSCKASFTDICQKVPVELMSAVYEQSVVVPTTNYLKLDGTDDKVTIPANTAYDLGSGDFTMEAFVIVDVRSTVPTPIVSKRTAAQGFVLYLNDNTLTLKIGSTVYTSSTFTSIKDQYLHQVGVSRQNGVITFYLDGRTVGTASSTLSINSTANLLLGSDAVDASYMKGYIQNVNFSSLANDFTSNAGLQIAPRSSAGIIGSWYMTGCSGQTYVKDYSIVSNNAYLGAVLGSESSDPVFSNPPVVILYNPSLNLNAVSFVSETNNSRHIEIPNNGAYGAFNSNFTIEAFVQGANAGVNSYPTIFSKRSASTNGLAIGINNGKVFVSIGSNIFYDNGSYNLNNNNCNHIVLVGQRILNKTFFYVFVNGVQTYSFSMSGYFNTSDPIWIGNDRGTANVFNASIDEIRIWNSTRLPDQINANRNSIFNSSTPNLIGYYRFKENINSQVVTDGSSLGNPGFLGNSTALDINDPIRVNLTCSSNSRTASLEELPEPENIAATEMQAPSILLYPNPFGTNCRLQIHHATGEATIHVMDAAGNVVFVKEKHPVSEELIFGDELPQGLYLLQFVNRPELKPVKFIKLK